MFVHFSFMFRYECNLMENLLSMLQEYKNIKKNIFVDARLNANKPLP